MLGALHQLTFSLTFANVSPNNYTIMKYELVNCKIVSPGTQLANGNEAKATYLATTVVSDENADNGFSLPFFNPGFIANARYCIENGMSIDAYMTDYLEKRGARIEKRTAVLDQVYFRRATDANGHLTNEPAKDKTTNKPIPYTKLDVHCIYSNPMEDAFDPATGIVLMEQDFRENGTPFMRPKRKYILDDAGRPVKEYWKGWSLIERRDQILSTFFMIAPPEYQTIANAQQNQQQPAPEQQQQQQQAPENTQQQQFAQMPDPLNG